MAVASTITLVIVWSALALVASVANTHWRLHRIGGLQAEALARADALTGLGNRRAFDEALTVEIARSRRLGRPLSLLLADLNGFKEINDRHGHLAGDHCLRQVAATFRDEVRLHDHCFRWGGDEFAAILADSDAAVAELIAERVTISVAERCRQPDGQAMTIGPAHAELTDAMTAEDLVAAADQALLGRKRPEIPVPSSQFPVPRPARATRRRSHPAPIRPSRCRPRSRAAGCSQRRPRVVAVAVAKVRSAPPLPPGPSQLASARSGLAWRPRGAVRIQVRVMERPAARADTDIDARRADQPPGGRISRRSAPAGASPALLTRASILTVRPRPRACEMRSRTSAAGGLAAQADCGAFGPVAQPPPALEVSANESRPPLTSAACDTALVGSAVPPRLAPAMWRSPPDAPGASITMREPISA
jgi:diguanylate cyclase (GGDEF)-like protein